MTTSLESVTPEGVAALHTMLLELGFSDGVTDIRTSVESLAASLFAPEPAAFAKFVRYGPSVAGFAIYSWKWGTFTGVLDMYVHAIFVRPECRRKGVARFAMSKLAEIAVAKGSSRIEWLTVRGKEMSYQFYESIGSQEADHMVIRRIQGAKLRALAGNAA
jgi:GNAT superfamily N-acetyltransferase